MKRLRVLVVDDAVIVRRLIAQALGREPDIEVVGTASDGDLALEAIAEQRPDVITLDIDMPGLDGLATLRRLRVAWPHLPVVMFTGVSAPGVAELEALALGANDLIPKLPHEGNMVNAIEWVSTRLAPRLREVAAQVARARALAAAPPRPAPAPVARVTAGPRVAPPPSAGRIAASLPEVLAVAASTGGPNALEALLKGLPADFRVPILITQHMPTGFTRLLADRLRAATHFQVDEAVPGAHVAPGQVWIAPGDHHLVVQRVGMEVVLQTNQSAPENSCRPAADPMFRSVARVYGPRSLAVVLTGMGQDGMAGAGSIVEAGGRILVQDEATSVVWGMPGAVARAGLAEAILPLGEMPQAIVERCRGGVAPVLMR
ncbi:MAG: chemotaxis-specific protein-glutamate methyltransferase CheB [Gemmatimonadetes bacterium]|nr:chemotaxis-specific protein-glutamate methyltransferase CheB [Gemmatimonadota bacterium]